MAEIAKQDEATPNAEVLNFMEFARRRGPQPLTPEEQAEFRRMWPLLMQMLREWEVIKAEGGCPIASRLLRSD